MRFEGKHKESTNAANIINCRKNTSLSLATKQQLKAINRSLSGRSLDDSNVEHGPGVKIPLLHAPHLLQTKGYSSIYIVEWIKVNGFKFLENYIVMVGFDDLENMPIFACIKNVYVCDFNDIYFLCSIITTEYFDSHCHAYIVNNSKETLTCINHNELYYCKEPMWLRTLPDLRKCVLVGHGL
jgi:hypothetical protein